MWDHREATFTSGRKPLGWLCSSLDPGIPDSEKAREHTLESRLSSQRLKELNHPLDAGRQGCGLKVL